MLTYFTGECEKLSSLKTKESIFYGGVTFILDRSPITIIFRSREHSTCTVVSDLG